MSTPVPDERFGDKAFHKGLNKLPAMTFTTKTLDFRPERAHRHVIRPWWRAFDQSRKPTKIHGWIL
jgi:hypothetical protein